MTVIAVDAIICHVYLPSMVTCLIVKYFFSSKCGKMGLVWPEKQKIKLKWSNVKKLCLTVGTDCIPVARQHKGQQVFSGECQY